MAARLKASSVTAPAKPGHAEPARLAPAQRKAADQDPADREATLRFAVVMPVLDEGVQIAEVIAGLIGQTEQLLVVDGGSRDGTAALAHAAGADVISAPRGRASQMNAGAAALMPGWSVVVFLHADTRLPVGWRDAVASSIRAGAQWGRFDVRLRSTHPMLGVVAAMMNLRSRLTGICTGDQAMFVTAAAWQRAGGFAPIELMEDIELSARLKRCAGHPGCLHDMVEVSARRWERHGVWRTIATMWSLRLRYFLGESPRRLHERYYGARR